MKRKLMSLVAVLGIGALTMVTQAATTVLWQDFESYTNGANVGPISWPATATNVTAVATNDGVSQVCNFNGYAIDNGITNTWDRRYNRIGTTMYGMSVSNNTSLNIADYTLDFDLAKLEGPTPTRLAVELRSPEFSTTNLNVASTYVVSDPATNAGLQHYSINLADFIEGVTLPISDMSIIDVSVYWAGEPDGAGPSFVEYQLDNIELALNPAPFTLGDRSPVGAITGLDQTISGSVINADSEADYAAMYLDDAFLADTNFYGASATNVFAREVMGLAEGPHRASIEVWDFATGTINRTFKWDFYSAANGPTNPIGFEGFEAYPVAKWNSAAAPAANPVPYSNGGTADANIVDEAGSNQVMRLDMNMDRAWEGGMYFNISMNGENVSRDISDYVLQFDILASSNSLANTFSFNLHINDANNSLVGSSYNVASFDPGYNIAKAGGTITIPLSSMTGLARGSMDPMDASASSWRLFFVFGGDGQAGDKPVLIDMDNMVVKYVKPPFLNETLSPQVLAPADPTISATVYDGTEEIDNMTLFVDGVALSNGNYAGGSTANTISYDWIALPQGWHTGMVVAASATLYAETNTWVFAVNGTPEPLSNNPLELYNINYAGYKWDAGTQYPVPDGTIAAAPSSGSDTWNNLIFNIYYWPDGNPTTITGSSGTNSVITHDVMDSSVVRNMQLPWSWAASLTFAQAAPDTIWPVTLGGTPIISDVQLSGLDAAATYDLYLYYVNPDNGNPTTTTYMLTSGSSQILVARLTSTRDSVYVSGSYSDLGNYVENENYVVIPGISPSALGIIGINVSGAPGGLSAMQLVKRGVNIPEPFVNGFSVESGEAYMTWDSMTGFSYSVLSTTNLVTGPWVEVTNGIAGDGWMLMPATEGEEFFKVQIQ